MTQVPIVYARQLWDDTREHSWPALLRTLKHHAHESKGVSTELAEALVGVVERIISDRRPYPETAEQLHDVLNSEISEGSQNEAFPI